MSTIDAQGSPSSSAARTRARSPLVATLVAAMSLLMSASSVFAAATAPLAGAEDWGYGSSPPLTFKVTGSGPAWFSGAVRTVLETEWLTNNRSGLPRFDYSSTGAGTVQWSRATASPCSGSTAWLACTPGAPDKGFKGWVIYVRDFSATGWGNTEWNESGACGSQTCYDLSRALLHEALHILFHMDHDESGETHTVMAARQPSKQSLDNTGWDTNSLRSCDVATGQILYDLHAQTDAYAQCLTAVTGLSEGIRTKITMAATSFTACSTRPRTFTAEARIGNYGQLGDLANNPLAGRTIKIYRRPGGGSFAYVGSTTATNTALGTPNVSASLSVGAPGAYVYQFRYASSGAGIDQVLLSSSGPEFTVNWSTGVCPL